MSRHKERALLCRRESLIAMPGMKKKRARGRKGAKTTAAKAPRAPPQSRPEPSNDGPGTDNPPYGDFGYFDVATTVSERRGRDLPSLANIVPSSPDDEATVEARALADAVVIRPGLKLSLVVRRGWVHAVASSASRGGHLCPVQKKVQVRSEVTVFCATLQIVCTPWQLTTPAD